jgi:hypothetical protein
MKSIRLRVFVVVALIAALPYVAPAPTMEQAPPANGKKSMQLQDIIDWKTVGATSLSKNGEWFAYRVAPQEGDAELIVKNVASGKELKFPLGEAAGGAAGAFVGGGASFSDDSKWIAFNTNPSRAEAQRLRRQRRPVEGKAVVVNLASGDKKEYPRIRRFTFSGETSTHIALHRAPAAAAGGGAATPATPPAGGGRGGAPTAAAGAPDNRPRGTDLILRELTTGVELNFGNVSEFSFSRDGKFMASVIDATDKIGNGIQLRNMLTGTVSVLDQDAANYERLAWTEKGDGLIALKGKEDRAYIERMFAIVGFTGFGSGDVKKAEFDP